MWKITGILFFLFFLLFFPQDLGLADTHNHDDMDYLDAFGIDEAGIYQSNIRAIGHGSRSLMKVALTFDDGPFAFTEEILNTLAAYRVKATFFMVGTQVEKFPHIARRIVAEGHGIGNHSYSHKHLTRVGRLKWKYEIDQGSVTIYKATGVLPRLFRAPYDLFNEEILDYVNGAGMIMVQYDVDPVDWTKPSAAKIKRRIMDEVKPGAIILCHDFSEGTRSGLGSLIEALKDSGYELVTVGEMISDLMPEPQKVETSKEGIF